MTNMLIIFACGGVIGYIVGTNVMFKSFKEAIKEWKNK